MMMSLERALRQLTQRYVDGFQAKTGHAPQSSELYGVASPCVVESRDESVLWLPRYFDEQRDLHKVEQALEITLHPSIHQFYASQYAGDIPIRFAGLDLLLVQVWSEDDFIRLQENLISHLFTQKKLKLAPTAFIATLDSELEIVSVCNITGEVILEEFGSKKRCHLADSLEAFLAQAEVIV